VKREGSIAMTELADRPIRDPLDPLDHRDRGAVVTGGAAGIGVTVARRFAEVGSPCSSYRTRRPT
jgi:hypothetical protein